MIKLKVPSEFSLLLSNIAVKNLEMITSKYFSFSSFPTVFLTICYSLTTVSSSLTSILIFIWHIFCI